MRILILGGDGYLGWPTAMYFSAKAHDVLAVDNYSRRLWALETDSEPLLPCPNLEGRAAIFNGVGGNEIGVRIGDLRDFSFMKSLFEQFRPECVVHYAEQPSAPYSMKGFEQARTTLLNNLEVTFNLIWAVMGHSGDCHIIKLGTMGEYGTPNIDIEEGWIEIEHKGRKDRFLFPRQASSLYHTTKIQDTDLLWFYVRTYGLRVTDLMQGPVYGLSTEQTEMDERLYPNFHYDDIFGTVVNRFLVQALSGIPLTVFGSGGQTRGYLNLKDTLQCVELAMKKPAERGELRIFNQLTETFSVNEIAEKVRDAAKTMSIDVKVEHIENPRKELEEHYYNPTYSGLLDLGLKPNFMTAGVLAGMMEKILPYCGLIQKNKILPRVKWNYRRKNG